MHKYRLCSFALDLSLSPNGPILIKSPQNGTVDPAIPDMSFVRTRAPQGEPGSSTVYLPGSSLKGALRSYCESIGRVLDLRPSVCDPFDEDCDCRKEPTPRSPMPVPERYQKSCPICRVFGSTRIGGRIAISDAYPINTVALSNRTGVGINRLLGSSQKGALYDFEVVEQGSFNVSLKLENFEFWQIGLLSLALRDLNEGHLRIGMGTSRGLGFVTVNMESAALRYTGLLGGAAPTRTMRNRGGSFPVEQENLRLLYDVADLLGTEASAYGIKPDGDNENNPLPIEMPADRIRDAGVEVQVQLKAAEDNDRLLKDFFAACVERLREMAELW